MLNHNQCTSKLQIQCKSMSISQNVQLRKSLEMYDKLNMLTIRADEEIAKA